MEKLLNELAKRLQAAYGPELLSLVLYGSAASGEYREKFSDLNVLCVLRAVGAPELRKGREAIEWWVKQKQPPPLLLSVEEIGEYTEAFPIEFLDIQHSNRLLAGGDLISGIHVDKRNYRRQLEHELRSGLLRLRGHYLVAQGRDKDVVQLMAKSLPSFSTLARHALLLEETEAGNGVGTKPVRKRDILAAAAKRFQLDVSPFEAVVRIREGVERVSGEATHSLFSSYLEQIRRLAEAVERL